MIALHYAMASNRKKGEERKSDESGSRKEEYLHFFETCTRKVKGEKSEMKLMESGITKWDIK